MPLLSRALKGSAFLLGRHAVISAVGFWVSLLLAWLLSPGDFGLFAVTMPPVTAMALLSELGLPAALIRYEGGNLRGVASRVWRFQSLAGACGLGLIIAFSGSWSRYYGFAPGTERILLLHALILVVLPLRGVGVALLERELGYARIAALETAEFVVSQCVVVVLAWSGGGAWALVAGPVVRAAVGALAAPAMAGWRPGRAPGWRALKPMLAFGAPLQANHFANFARDAVVPLVVARVAGVESAGIIRWATSVANYPAMVLLNAGRTFYPLYARMRRSGAGLRRSFEGTVSLAVWGMGLASVPLFGLGEPLVRLAFPARWLPAVPLFALFVPVNLAMALIVPATHMLNALGKPGIRLAFATAGGVLLWTGTVLTVSDWGATGFAVSNLAMNGLELGMLVVMARRLGGVRLPWRNLAAATACAGGLLAVSALLSPLEWPGLAVAGVAGTVAYIVLAANPFRKMRS